MKTEAPQSLQPLALDAAAILTLRQEARAADQPVALRIQEKIGLSPEATLQTLASQSQLPAFDMAALNALNVDFSGLSFNEVAELIGVTERTVQRDWTAARALLERDLESAR